MVKNAEPADTLTDIRCQSQADNINTVAKYCNYCKKTGHIQMLDVKWTLRNGIREGNGKI